MYCMDLWPASLEVGGIKRVHRFINFIMIYLKNLYNVDKILVTSRMFQKYFIEEFGISENRIEYLPQYAISEFDNIPNQPEKIQQILYLQGMLVLLRICM